MKKDILFHQKRPIISTKETYNSIKRDLQFHTADAPRAIVSMMYLEVLP